MSEEKIRKQWFVFYTKSRQEKKVRELLLKNDFEPFLPIQKVMRQWSDRKKKVDAPLFNSYIFVRIEEYRIVDVLKIPGVSWNIRHNGKPAFLREKEYEQIKRYIETGLFIETSNKLDDFKLGEKVKILDGPLKGFVGSLTKRNSENLFSVFIDSLNYSLTIQIDSQVLEKV
jgi:transcription termination/antitermination protein NusG